MHNGEVDNFDLKRGIMISSIDPKQLPKIKGTTDSEHFFYLYLTFLVKNDSLMVEAINDMFVFFIENKINVVANIICSIGDQLLVSRNTIGNSEKYPLLFIDDDISSLKITTQ